MRKSITIILSSILLAFSLCFPDCLKNVSAAPISDSGDSLPRLVDNADLLSPDEESALVAKLDQISERRNYDVVIVTLANLGGKSAQAYADDFYDYSGYGMGDTNDGVLLLVSMDEREYHVTTVGAAIDIIDDVRIDEIDEKITPDLTNGEYYAAFETFASICDRSKIQPLHFIVSIVIGCILAFVVVGAMKAKLKTVRRQPGANNYVRENSLNLTRHSDIYLYTHIDRRAKPKDNNSGGRSGTHVSSSGVTHGGGGGKF